MFVIRRRLTLFLACICFIALAVTKVSAQKTEYGAYLGLIPGDNENFFVDNEYGTWANRDFSFILSGQYNIYFGSHFLLGAYAELETISLSGGFDDGFRLGTGLVWTGRTGRLFFDWFKLEFGGYGGLAFASHSGRDKMTGVDFGVFFGPYYEINEKILAAFHVADGYGYYHGDTNPYGMQNVRPFFKLQIYYRP